MNVDEHLSAFKDIIRQLPHPMRYESLMKAASELVEEAADGISSIAPPNRCAEHLLLSTRLDDMASDLSHLQ